MDSNQRSITWLGGMECGPVNDGLNGSVIGWQSSSSLLQFAQEATLATIRIACDLAWCKCRDLGGCGGGAGLFGRHAGLMPEIDDDEVKWC
jgi:hypothetical protein